MIKKLNCTQIIFIKQPKEKFFDLDFFSELLITLKNILKKFYNKKVLLISTNILNILKKL